MDGFSNGKPYEQMDDLGVLVPPFSETPKLFLVKKKKAIQDRMVSQTAQVPDSKVRRLHSARSIESRARTVGEIQPRGVEALRVLAIFCSQ